MASKALPSPEVLRQLLRYEPDTGKLFWLPRTVAFFQDGVHSAEHSCAIWNAQRAGREAFTVLRTGYPAGKIFDQTLQAHRVIWAIVTGAWPEGEIDHINRIRSDNRWCNLRVATRAENQWNRPATALSKSGVKGAYWHKSDKSWRASIKVNGRSVHLGRFATRDEAAAAYAQASVKYHGEFGRVA